MILELKTEEAFTRQKKTGEVDYPKQKNRKKALRGWYTWKTGKQYKIKQRPVRVEQCERGGDPSESLARPKDLGKLMLSDHRKL